MKKIAVLMTMMVLTQLTVMAAGDKVNYYTPYYNQPNIINGRKVNYAEKNTKVYKPDGNNFYIQKYNVDDLEEAPWVNGGKRKSSF